jgi:hypothetical protein
MVIWTKALSPKICLEKEDVDLRILVITFGSLSTYLILKTEGVRVRTGLTWLRMWIVAGPCEYGMILMRPWVPWVVELLFLRVLVARLY